jgi:hypothetical protein
VSGVAVFPVAGYGVFDACVVCEDEATESVPTDDRNGCTLEQARDLFWKTAELMSLDPAQSLGLDVDLLPDTRLAFVPSDLLRR